MYAGRYLWWNAVAAMAYVFFSVYFYYVTWLAIRVSGCASVVGSCGTLDTKLNGLLRPYGMLICGVVVLASGVLRIHFLRMSPLWGLALFIWFGASAEFFFTFGDLWFAKLDMATILLGMPVETLFLGALVTFLCLPIELYQRSPAGGLRLIHHLASFTASYSFTFTVANSPKLLDHVRLIGGSEDMVGVIQAVQQRLRIVLALGHSGWTPMVAAFALFLASLTYLAVLRKAPGGQAVADIP